MRDVSYDRPVAAKLYVHLDNGETFEAKPEDLARFGVVAGLSPAAATQLRVDGPRREPEPAEITAAMLDAAEVRATVQDADSDHATWTKGEDGVWSFRAFRRSAADLVEMYGPLSNLRPPEPAKAAALASGDWSDEHDEPGAEPSTVVDDTRRALIATVHRTTAERVEAEMGGNLGRPLSSARGAVDQAAREHVAALDGPATDLSTGPRRLAVTATLDTVPGPVDGMPWLALRIGAMVGKGVVLVQAYEPAKLAARSVVVTKHSVYVATLDAGLAGDDRWLAAGRSGYTFCRNEEVPTDGVLVVDGATLGGDR